MTWLACSDGAAQNVPKTTTRAQSRAFSWNVRCQNVFACAIPSSLFLLITVGIPRAYAGCVAIEVAMGIRVREQSDQWRKIRIFFTILRILGQYNSSSGPASILSDAYYTWLLSVSDGLPIRLLGGGLDPHWRNVVQTKNARRENRSQAIQYLAGFSRNRYALISAAQI